MSSTDTAYYRSRAEQEREAAHSAVDEFIAAIHLELAVAYEALLTHPELRSDLKIVTG